MKLQAVGHKIIVKPVEKKDVTEGGILLAQTAQEKEGRGMIISMGSLVDIVKEIQTGDTIRYHEFATLPIKEGAEVFHVILDNDVIAKVKV